MKENKPNTDMGNAPPREERRRVLLGVLALTGTAYAAPLLLTANEVEAASRPDGPGRGRRSHPSHARGRRSRPSHARGHRSRPSRHRQHSRPSRHRKGSRPSRYRQQQRSRPSRY